jgi:hypothetical protein
MGLILNICGRGRGIKNEDLEYGPLKIELHVPF